VKRRYLYVLMFAVPALLAAALIALAVFGAAALGALWIFVYGDNAWPAWPDQALPALFALVFLALSFTFLALAFAAGRKQEENAAFNPKHAWAAVAVSAGVILFMLLYSWRAGNIGPPPPGANCAAYCQSRGYAGSGTPPRNAPEQTCSCFDSQGREAVKIPLGDVEREMMPQARRATAYTRSGASRPRNACGPRSVKA
jgi:hypothetical protein